VYGDISASYRAKLAREHGSVVKEWGGRMTVALAYPNRYHLGMSNLGFQLVYQLLNRHPDVVAERVFLPDEAEASLYQRSGRPLCSLESQRPLGQFDMIAFSLSFENDYPNVLKVLALGGIPLFSEEREEACPLVGAGGITTFLNPEPLALFMDFFLLGEAEALLDPLIEFFRHTGAGQRRMDCLLDLARNLEGFYVPSFYRVAYESNGTLRSHTPSRSGIPEKIRVGRSLGIASGSERIAVSSVLTPDTEFGDRVLVEAGRGCGWSCRFCAAGYVYRPPRLGSEAVLRGPIEASMSRCNRFGLVAAAVSDIPGIEVLTSMILRRGGRFSVSSLRAGTLTEELLQNLKKSGQRTVAIAPEAGSERLRRVINKHLSEEQILEAARLIAGTGAFSVRLYFLVGLPTETRDDLREVVELVKKFKHHMVKESAARGKIGKIKLSVNCFVPKASTPFQWFPMEPVDSLKEKQKWLRKNLSKIGGVEMSADVPKWAYVQALLSLGDRRAGLILYKAHELDGRWQKAFRFSEVNPDFFVYRPKEPQEILPWDFIETGVAKSHLLEEYGLALQARESDICRVGQCRRCGACAPLN